MTSKCRWHRLFFVAAALVATVLPVGRPAHGNHYNSVCVDGVALKMYTSSPMYAFGAGPWMSGGFGGQALVCPVNGFGAHWYQFGGSIAGFCGFATGYAEYMYGSRVVYLWVGAVMLSYGTNPTVPNTLQPLRVATHIVVPDAAFGHTCTTVGGASTFLFAGTAAQYFIGWA